MKILFTPYGGGSIAHIVRSLAVADELKRRGHDILFTSTKTKKKIVEQAGYKVFGHGHAEANLNDEHDQSINYFRNNKGLFLDWLGDEIHAAEYYKPDIIVNSPSFFGPLASIKLGIPYVAIINAPWLVEFKGLLGLSKSSDSVLHQLIRKAGRPIFIREFEKVYLVEIQEFYNKLGIKDVPLRRMDLHNKNAALIPSVPEFEPIEKNGRSNIHYIGPLFWNGFEKQDFDLRDYFSDIRKPFIYVTLGGSIHRKESYEILIRELSQKHDWNVLLSLGPNFTRDNFMPDQDHFVIRPFVPGLKACEYADAVINTGGHGTVMQALWHGKPVIAIPHNIDQATIASRLEELGVGVNLNKVGVRDFSNREKYFMRATQIPWASVIKRTEGVLADGKLKEKAKMFKKVLRNYPCADQAAADYIERYARKR